MFISVCVFFLHLLQCAVPIQQTECIKEREREWATSHVPKLNVKIQSHKRHQLVAQKFCRIYRETATPNNHRKYIGLHRITAETTIQNIGNRSREMCMSMRVCEIGYGLTPSFPFVCFFFLNKILNSGDRVCVCVSRIFFVSRSHAQ